jgi:glyoxylase-like metal-dependent hydrolase (beta-lactamase superfamily II)
MLKRQPLFPHVIEINHQAGHIIGSNVYLIYDGDQWMLIDVGMGRHDRLALGQRKIHFANQIDNLLDRIGVADVDHIQGLAKAKQTLRTSATAHPLAAAALRRGDRLFSFAEIPAQNIDMELAPIEIEHEINEGDRLRVGSLELDVWLTPGHSNCQLCLRMGDLLFSGDNVFRDGCVGAIDAHHGSDLPAFVRSLQRIRASDAQWLLPSHGPYFRKDDRLLDAVITRLQRYQHMADFGTCAAEWPLMDQWEQELMAGKRPK